MAVELVGQLGRNEARDDGERLSAWMAAFVLCFRNCRGGTLVEVGVQLRGRNGSVVV